MLDLRTIHEWKLFLKAMTPPKQVKPKLRIRKPKEPAGEE
jgi:hypothetical protein